ncbi:MAG: transposase [Thermoflexales bacterium]|nr:transposase [Thermoflexales bacterium]
MGLKICDVSRQALQKRVLKSTAWLRHLLALLLQASLSVPRPPAAASGEQEPGPIRRLLIRDASTISRPGSPGTEWRLHLTWEPFTLQLVQVTLTDARSGEGPEDAGLQAGDLLLADRAYGIWRTIQVALDALAFFIIRLTWSNLPLLTPEGHPFNLVAWLRRWPATQNQAEISVIAADDPQRRPFRLVVGRLPSDKAEKARQDVRRQARKHKRPVHPNTLLAAGFCILLINLPATLWPTQTVLAFYRIRWQIEWCFRRWKSVCQLDRLPPYPTAIAEPVLLAKLILILLMQRHLGALPWSEWWAKAETAPVVTPAVKMIYDHLCEIIRPSAVILQLLENPASFLRHLRSSQSFRYRRRALLSWGIAAISPIVSVFRFI